MAVSQYKYYTSDDASAPQIDGTAGSLIAVLDGCLVTGYGSRTAAGWTHPVATASNIAAYQQGAGSGFGVVVNDNGPNATAAGKEAWATGWESVASVTGPVGTGTGQFPTPAQLLTTGHVVWRKSAAADSTTRPWRVWADASTFNLWISAGDNTAVKEGCVFGDIFSVAGSGDLYRCLIMGKNAENTTGSGVSGSTQIVTTAVGGHFMARTYDGTGTSIPVGKHCDVAKSGNLLIMSGLVQSPNLPDNSFYVSPVWVHESTGNILRGKLRGVYQLCHAPANFADGKTFNGANVYAGKAFQIVVGAQAAGNTGMIWVYETSNTLDTN